MTKAKIHPQTIKPIWKYILGTCFVLMSLAILAGAASIPFFFQSTSMWYKFGLDRTLLRTGKVLGMLAATLLIGQILFVGGPNILEKVFSKKRLIATHKFNAGLIACLALIHPLFVFAPEDITTLRPEVKYWPEIVGAVLLVLLWLIFTTGKWRQFLNFTFKPWRRFHQISVVLAVALLSVHILFVSDTFRSGLPRYAVFSFLAVFVLLWMRLRIKKR